MRREQMAPLVWLPVVHQSPPTKETIFFLGALDGPGLQIGVLLVGLQMLSNPHLSLSNKHSQGHSYEHLTYNWSAVGK